jgi:hypothetical protein
LGITEIELIELQGAVCRPIFENRFWGDWGFIHLCFDIQGMDAFKARCAEFGNPFTVDSDNSFDMGEAAGRFSYIEDPDGYWIEFVETHKVPIFKKLGLYLNLKQGKKLKHLPKWMLKALSLNRVKQVIRADLSRARIHRGFLHQKRVLLWLCFLGKGQ